MGQKIISFEDLVVWQKAQEFAVNIYKLADTNKLIAKDFSLRDQLKSAAISISDNIAEGFEYNNNPDFKRFLRMAKGSCGEIRSKILFLRKLNYIDENTAAELNQYAAGLGRQIGDLIKKVSQKIANSNIRNP